MKGQLFRIAHIGYYDYLGHGGGVLAALEQVIAEVSGKSFDFGSAVRAAQGSLRARQARIRPKVVIDFKRPRHLSG